MAKRKFYLTFDYNGQMKLFDVLPKRKGDTWSGEMIKDVGVLGFILNVLNIKPDSDPRKQLGLNLLAPHMITINLEATLETSENNINAQADIQPLVSNTKFMHNVDNANGKRSNAVDALGAPQLMQFIPPTSKRPHVSMPSTLEILNGDTLSAEKDDNEETKFSSSDFKKSKKLYF